jgi:hypothetical protein
VDQENGSTNERFAQTGANLFSHKQLEELSGFSHQTIYRFKKRLRDQDAYEALLRGPSWRKAMGLRGSSDEKVISAKNAAEARKIAKRRPAFSK